MPTPTPSDCRSIRDAVAAEIKRWLTREGYGGVPVVAGWSLTLEIDAGTLDRGKTHVLVTQGPMGVVPLNRSEIERDIGLQISVVQLLPQQDAPTLSNLDEVVALREKLEAWLQLAAHSNDAIHNPHGDYSFSEFLRAASTEQPLVEEYLIKTNAAVSYFMPSWSTG